MLSSIKRIIVAVMLAVIVPVHGEWTGTMKLHQYYQNTDTCQGSPSVITYRSVVAQPDNCFCATQERGSVERWCFTCSQDGGASIMHVAPGRSCSSENFNTVISFTSTPMTVGNSCAGGKLSSNLYSCILNITDTTSGTFEICPTPSSPPSLPPSPSPRSPPSSPAPPGRPGATLQDAVSFVVTVEGDVSSFDKVAYKTALASQIDGVYADDIQLTVSPASVVVTAVFAAANNTAAISKLSMLAADLSALSTALGVKVESAATPFLIQAMVTSSVSSPDGDGCGGECIGIVAGIVAGIFVPLLLCILWLSGFFARKGCPSPLATKRNDEPKFPAF